MSEQQLVLEEPSGSRVIAERLGAGATTFYLVEDGSWTAIPPEDVEPGQQVCVEALMAGTRLLALRVFLGTGCGPS